MKKYLLLLSLVYIQLFSQTVEYGGTRIFTGTLEVDEDAIFTFKGTDIDSIVVSVDSLYIYIGGIIYKALQREYDPVYSSSVASEISASDTNNYREAYDSLHKHGNKVFLDAIDENDTICLLHVNISKDGDITSFNTLVTLTAYVNETGVTYNWDGGTGSNKTLITPTIGNHNVVVSKSGCINDTAEIYIVDQTDFHENYNIDLPPYSASDSLLSLNSFLNGTPVANQIAVFKEDGKEIGGEDSIIWNNRSLNIVGKENLDDNYDNVIIGKEAGYLTTSGSEDNTIIGRASGYNLSTGDDNVFIGINVGFSATSASNNILIGSGVGQNMNGNYNTIIGAYAYTNTATGNYNIMIGSYSGTQFASNRSNRIIINSLSRSNIAEDTTLSIIYGLQAATTAAQRLWLNANVYISDSLVGTKAYFDSIYTDLTAAWADEGLSKDYNYGNFWEDLTYALQNGYLITFKDKSDNWPIQRYLKALAITQERTIRQMADELIIRDNEIIRLERKIDNIQLLRNERLIFIFIGLLLIWCIILTLRKR